MIRSIHIKSSAILDIPSLHDSSDKRDDSAVSILQPSMEESAIKKGLQNSSEHTSALPEKSSDEKTFDNSFYL